VTNGSRHKVAPRMVLYIVACLLGLATWVAVGYYVVGPWGRAFLLRRDIWLRGWYVIWPLAIVALLLISFVAYGAYVGLCRKEPHLGQGCREGETLGDERRRADTLYGFGLLQAIPAFVVLVGVSHNLETFANRLLMHALTTQGLPVTFFPLLYGLLFLWIMLAGAFMGLNYILIWFGWTLGTLFRVVTAWAINWDPGPRIGRR